VWVLGGENATGATPSVSWTTTAAATEQPGSPGRCYARGRIISDCHFAVQLNQTTTSYQVSYHIQWLFF
jgi:hypothetical protein